MKRILLMLVLAALLTGCGTSVAGRSGPGGGVSVRGNVPVAVW